MRENGTIPKGFEFALFCTAMLWALAASSVAGKAAHGLTVRFNLPSLETLLSAVLLIFLCWFGFQMLDWIATRRGGEAAAALALPLRASFPQELGLGAAIGWGLALIAVVPVLLTLNLHGHLRLGAANLGSVLLAAVTLAAVTLAEETIARGYALQRLASAVGPSWAAVLISVGFSISLILGHIPRHVVGALLDGVLLGLLLAMAYLRTHALWAGWGLHFAYRAVAALLLGLPIAGRTDLPSIADTYMTGPGWLTGGAFGLDSTFFTGLFLLGAMLVVYHATRDYAWRYTHREIVGAAYEVVVPPPAAHVAMEQQAAAAPTPLVQILPVTPGGFSVRPGDPVKPE